MGISNCTVTAHLQWPAGIMPQPKTNIFAMLDTPRPEIPREIITNSAALAEFVRTKAYQQAAKKYRDFPAKFDENDLITVEDVEPGEYQLTVFVRKEKSAANTDLRTRLRAVKSVNVPGGRPLDIGVLELKVIPPAQQP
jgi:hypothetical protein